VSYGLSLNYQHCTNCYNIVASNDYNQR